MEYDYSIAVEYNNKRINELIETTENNQRRINELTEKINKQIEVNKHINNKFRKVWDCINADHLRLEAVEEVITGINDRLDKIQDVKDDLNYRWDIVKESGLLDGKQNLAIQRLEKRVNELEAQECATTSIIEDNSCDILTLQDAIINNEAEASQDVINAVLNDFLNDVKKLLNDNTQTIKSDNKTRFVNVHNIQLIVDRYINNNNINLSNKGGE